MKKIDPAYFHKLYGAQSPRLAYHRGDFLDYMLMISLCALVIGLVYGAAHWLSVLGLALCAAMVATFVIRHGAQLRTPMIVRRPQDILYMLIYKLQNVKGPYLVAAAVLLLENYLIYLTPTLPHHVDWMGKFALSLFYTHFVLLTAYRTAILISHLRRKDHVREFLLQTTWKSALERQPSIQLEILHAYFTGLLAHVILVAPWYLIITHVDYSLIFFPVTFVASLLIHRSFMKVLNEWFYRDHWLGHNSELDFLYLHGPHHDAIPSGLIGVSGNGFLEGFTRYVLGGPGIFYNPLALFIVYSLDVKTDIDGHQFISGVYPHVPKSFQEINQHSTHHYGRLEPYSVGLNLDQAHVSEEMLRKTQSLPDEMRNSVKLDEILTGFKWDTPRYQRFLQLYEQHLAVREPDSPRSDTNGI